MRSPSSADRVRALVGRLPAAATATAEGAWVAVMYSALEVAISHRAPSLTPWAFVLAAAAGLACRRLMGKRSEAGMVGAAVIGGAAVVGWLASPASATQLVAGTAIPAMVTGIGGWLMGMAAWRGSGHADAATDDVATASLLAWAVPGLAVPWVIGMADEPSRAGFVAVGLPTTLLFVAAGLLAVGLTRLEALGQATGVDWRGNRPWLGLLVAVVAGATLIGLPFAILLGAPIETILGTVVGPLGWVAEGLFRLAAFLVGPLADAVGHLAGAGPGVGGAGVTPVQPESADGAAASAIPGWVGVAVLVVVAVALFAVAIWLRRGGGRGSRTVELLAPEPPREERHFVLPGLPGLRALPSLPRLSFSRRKPPSTASAAYLAVLGAFESHATLAREPTESPARHSRRLRSIGRGSLALDLLAADFALERYAGGTLTARERRRAVGRWRVLPKARGARGRREES